MTTATIAKPRVRKNRPRLLPPTAGVAKVAGTDFVIMPLTDFEEWQEDQLLAAVAAERRRSGEEIVPFTEIEARLERRARGRKHVCQELIDESGAGSNEPATWFT